MAWAAFAAGVRWPGIAAADLVTAALIGFPIIWNPLNLLAVPGAPLGRL